MAYIGRKPTNAPLTSADIQNGTITNDDLASGVAVANIGYTPANVASLANVATSGSYNDLSNKPTIPTVPTAVSSFTNDAGYLTSYTETDPVFVASAAYGITGTDKANWNAAYGWGNHASAGYLTTSSASSTYLTQVNASSTYQPISGMSSYLTTSSASSTYAPISTTVTLTGSQTLTNKTLTGYTETVYNLTGTDISPANGTIQYKTLGANTTFTESLADGQCVTLMLNPATYTVTWPTTTWVGSVASTAPTLVASVYNCITFFQIAGVLYGKYEGRV